MYIKISKKELDLCFRGGGLFYIMTPTSREKRPVFPEGTYFYIVIPTQGGNESVFHEVTVLHRLKGIGPEFPGSTFFYIITPTSREMDLCFLRAPFL